jgi:hypothetical protein
LCGFCQNGMMIKATELLEHNATPTVAEIKAAFTTSGPSAHLCRCGSYTAIIEAVQRAATSWRRHKRGYAMAISNEKPVNVFGAHSDAPQLRQSGRRPVRRLRRGGRRRPEESGEGGHSNNTLDPTLPESWIEIHPDNTILIRTGKSDFGQSTTFTAYRQIVAEELNAPFEAITTVVMGDTDRTPDGSGAFDFLGRGTPNIRKAAAYTYQALLDLAAQRLGVPKSSFP